MRLLTEVVTTYRCATCGTVHPAFPEQRCCEETPTAADDETLLTIGEVAQRCQVAKSTVQAWINDGRLTAVRPDSRVVRVRRGALEEFWSQHATS